MSAKADLWHSPQEDFSPRSPFAGLKSRAPDNHIARDGARPMRAAMRGDR
jgi:hypothetical protein